MTNNSLDMTENALKLTNTTLELTEIEQQKRDIEKRLELFYYPVSNHFEIKRGKGPKGGLSETDRRDLLHAESFRDLAHDITREQFETWREAETEKAAKQNSLTTSINADIKEYQKTLKDLEKEIQTLINQKTIEALGVKKPWWRFW